MRRALFSYHLPLELVASHPPAERDGGRLLVVDPRGEPSLSHASIRDLPRLLPPGALVVVNDARVLPVRLLGTKEPSGGRVELLLTRPCGAAAFEHAGRVLEAERFRALGRASKGLREGTEIVFRAAGGERAPLRAVVAKPVQDGSNGTLEVLLFSPEGLSVLAAIEAVGHVPLPPYVRRPDEAGDRERYQTVFARVPGAAAAPTAGLHLSPRLLCELEGRGLELSSVTLHVGPGTFQPVTVDDLDAHPMHEEDFEVPEATCRAIERARSRGAKVVAVGTTVVRALESAADDARPGHARPLSGATRLLIQPGHRFRVVDALLTNFHLPESTLLALVCAFGGTERVLSAYRAAIDARYRFYSYGDAMLVRARSEP